MEIPPFENKESKEGAEERLTQLLKEKGIEDPEARNLLDIWTREQERRVEEEKSPTGAIELNLKRARLYWKSGYKDEAWENFESAREQAWNEKRDELCKAIEEEMNTLEDNKE